MGFSDAIQWWEEWQLRVLVVCSLFLQRFLFIVLLCLGSDCLSGWPTTQSATHASDKHQPACVVGAHSVRAPRWAGILKTNELWRRHVLAAVSQVSAQIDRNANTQ